MWLRSRVESSPRSSNIQRTQSILARSSLALLPFTGDFNQASSAMQVRGPKRTLHIMAQSDLVLLLSTTGYAFGESVCIVALAESREFNTQDLTLKEPDAFFTKVAWLSYFLRAMSREFSTQFHISKESDAFLPEAAWLSYFIWAIADSSESRDREPRVLHIGFNTEGTPSILALLDFALLPSTCDYYVASTKSRGFPTHFLKSKESDALWHEAAWLSYFRWTMMTSVES
ncbi:hypothetical protein Csa_016306 [Cucumis sativus]|uniref:Uncharacterized protein n=1 Tax=Cucumis sativus TaxID=3659 RepID=A0A0A0K3X3_CUCSA|nr:hypothetical protein Csa_016306 [Cucumis sativus]